MGGTFFASWALWEQMTFVLLVAMILVFLAGLVRLWLNNRSLRHHEVLDEEKRVRVETLRKTGVFQTKGPEIPFGIRAIQSGVEVDGIWISGRNTPADSDAGSTRESPPPLASIGSDMSEPRTYSEPPRLDHPLASLYQSGTADPYFSDRVSPPSLSPISPTASPYQLDAAASPPSDYLSSARTRPPTVLTQPTQSLLRNPSDPLLSRPLSVYGGVYNPLAGEPSSLYAAPSSHRGRQLPRQDVI